jgi:hypothetical protein
VANVPKVDIYKVLSSAGKILKEVPLSLRKVPWPVAEIRMERVDRERRELCGRVTLADLHAPFPPIYIVLLPLSEAPPGIDNLYVIPLRKEKEFNPQTLEAHRGKHLAILGDLADVVANQLISAGFPHVSVLRRDF